MRPLLCAAALLLPSVVWAEPLVDSAHVIYRESTDDYLFRVAFTYEPDLWTMTRRNPPATVSYPDTNFAFVINGHDGRQVGVFTSMDVPETGRVSLYDWRSVDASAQPIGSFDFSLNDNVFAATVPRSLVDELQVAPLFGYVFWSERVNVGEWPVQYIPRTVALNVPEPSTLGLAMGCILLAVPLAIRRLRHRRQPSR